MDEFSVPDPKKLFKKLVCEYEARIKLRDLGLRPYFATTQRATEYFRKYPEYFVVFEDDDGSPQMVGARLQGMALCIPYSQRRRGYMCYEADCPLLHLCRDYVAGYCFGGLNCERSHTFKTESNKRVLRRLGLLDTSPPYPEEKLLDLLRMSLPQVCGWYNNLPDCPNGSACTRFHICKRNVLTNCIEPSCSKAHDLNSQHSIRLKKIYQLEGKSFDEVKDMMLVHKVMPKDDDDYARIKCAVVLDAWRRTPAAEEDMTLFGSPLGVTAAGEVDREFATISQMPVGEGALNPEELAQIQEAMNEKDLTECFILQHLMEGQNDLFLKEEETTPKKGEPAATPSAISMATPAETRVTEDKERYLCEEYVNGKCSDAQCPDLHFPSPFLWQIKLDGRWHGLDYVNDELEEAQKTGSKDYVTEVPCCDKGGPDQILLIKFKPKIKATLMNSGATIKIRRLSTRSQAHLALHPLLQPKKPSFFAFSQDTGDVFQVASSVSEKAKPSPVTQTGREKAREDVQWEIHIGNDWRALGSANKEIELAYQDKKEEYYTELPGDEKGEFIVLDFVNKIAVPLDGGVEYEIRRTSRHCSSDAVAETSQADTTAEQLHDQTENVDKSSDEEGDGEISHKTIHCWQWRDENLRWIPFNEFVSYAIEKWYTGEKTTCDVRVDGEKWRIDYLTETGTNLANGEEHHIRRVNK